MTLAQQIATFGQTYTTKLVRAVRSSVDQKQTITKNDTEISFIFSDGSAIVFYDTEKVWKVTK